MKEIKTRRDLMKSLLDGHTVECKSMDGEKWNTVKAFQLCTSNLDDLLFYEYRIKPTKPNDTNHFPGIGNMVFDPDAALTLAERTLDVEITEPLADDIVKFSRKLYERYAQADHFADVGKMIEVKVPSDDDSLTIAYMCGYNDGKRSATPEGWKPVPVEPTYDMTQAGVNLALSARISGAYPWPTYIRDMYKTMLEAAPKFGEEE